MTSDASLVVRGAVLTCTLLAATLVAPLGHAARLAIIIDDLGNQRGLGQRAVRLSAPVAVAVLPHTPFARELAREAHDRGKEVIVHVPMQPERSDVALGPGALHDAQSQTEFTQTLVTAVTAVPHAAGVSNHMGSLLTRDLRHMTWLMRELQLRGLFFIDSYTTHLSRGLGVARSYGVPALKRDVFLDGVVEQAAILVQWERLLAIADDTGFAIAIAHPYSITLTFLEAMLPDLDAEVYTVVPLRTLLPGAGKPERNAAGFDSPDRFRGPATDALESIE